jgi:hypothetical protein
MLALLMGCSQSSAPDPDSAAVPHIWVEQHFHNGDGGNFVGSEPPNTFNLLEAAGIIAQKVVVEVLPTCMGPGCPSYSGRHFAKIAQRDFARATQLGFKRSEGPTD